MLGPCVSMLQNTEDTIKKKNFKQEFRMRKNISRTSDIPFCSVGSRQITTTTCQVS